MTRVTLSVDPDLDVAPFQQIAAQLREFVERGDLRPGDALPTVRQLAVDLGVAPNTVARAYTDLQDAGWLTSDGRRGTRVAQAIPADDARGRAAVLRSDVDRFISDARRRGYSKSEIRAALEHAGAKI
ncbi:MAG TPA: GntR family transcriptional regulator [Candidatus Baltobacteraceae bacterium]|nr:GntR family transcriptional regulator [Candidatus Baltobacteraceae bacterium]